MKLLVLPVSGGAFPLQLALIAELSNPIHHINKNIEPDLVMASSGGNVAAYISLAAQWDGNKISDIAKNLHSSMFIQSWWPSYLKFMPSWMIGYFKGSLYCNGSGATELFEKMFTPETIAKTEIWTGTLNRQ